ncbi:MAG: hypothetical protein JRJ23_11880 [Deltaproteobacteria bacterium]|nr:hypothetical protein [Deltaproteobacteria bacterium]
MQHGTGFCAREGRTAEDSRLRSDKLRRAREDRWQMTEDRRQMTVDR